MKNQFVWTRSAFVLIFIMGVMEYSFGNSREHPNQPDSLKVIVDGPGIIEFVSPEEGKVVRRRKYMRVRWTGDLTDATVQIQLMRGTTLVQNLGRVKNDGSFLFKISRKMPLGEYQIRLVTSQGEVYSKPFEVKKPTAINQVIRTVWLTGITTISSFFLFGSIALILSDGFM